MPFVENKGVKLHYVVIGQGPPIVLIHGGFGSFQEWYIGGYVDSLKDNYQLILVDLRGHGQSDRLHDSLSYSTRNFTSDIIAILDDLKIDKAHCWGYSLGGHLAFCLSRDYPERFLSFIIGGMYPQGLIQRDLDREKRIREHCKEGPDGFIRYSKETGQNVTPEMERGIRTMDFKSINAWINSEDLFRKADEHLPDLDIPFLLYAGELDEWEPHPLLVEVSKKMKNAETILFEGKGHNVQFEQGVVLPHVLEFLEGFISNHENACI